MTFHLQAARNSMTAPIVMRLPSRQPRSCNGSQSQFPTGWTACHYRTVDASTPRPSSTQKAPGRPLLASLGERPGFVVYRQRCRNMDRISRRIPLDPVLSNSSNGFQTVTSRWRDSTDTGIPASRISTASRFGTYPTARSRRPWSEPVKQTSSTLFRRLVQVLNSA